jgi:hypothetical protein
VLTRRKVDVSQVRRALVEVPGAHSTRTLAARLLLGAIILLAGFVVFAYPGRAAAEQAAACREIRAADGETAHRSTVLTDMVVKLSFACSNGTCRASVTHADQSLKTFKIESGQQIDVCTRDYVPSGRPSFADCGDGMRAFEIQMKTRVGAGFDRYFEADFVWLEDGARKAARCIKLIDGRFEIEGFENLLQPQKSWIAEPFRITVYEYDNAKF